MTLWYVKDLSKITGVTVQTLHHYDHIDLLKPSVRRPNGYRLYSEGDLLKLQQIIALKFFGFELIQIKTLLKGDVDMADHFAMQAQFLEEKAKTLSEASQTLKRILSDCGDNTIPWENVIKLIEVYRMTQELEKSWAGKVLTPDELTQYADFRASLKTRFTEEEKKTFEEEWAKLLVDIQTNLDQNPRSEIGISIAKRSMDRVNALYGRKNAALRNSVWNKGFKGGHMEKDYGMTPEMVDWLDDACEAFYRGRICFLLDQVDPNTPTDFLDHWNAIMVEMFGDSATLKLEFIDAILTDKTCTPAIRQWLKEWGKGL